MKPKFYHYRRPTSAPKVALLYQTMMERACAALGISPRDFPSAITRCIIEDDQREPLAEGWAVCSARDQFSRKIGRQISEGRARKICRQIAEGCAP